jgi:cell wall-associated NlpC family hydrolase
MLINTFGFVFIGQVALALPSILDARDVVAQEVGFISVSVATVWTDSSKPRPVDAPALTNPADIEGWLSSMSLDQYLDLTDSDRTQTQALYGTRVSILSQQGGWYEVAVDGQPTPKNTLGYPGWVPAAQVSLDSTYGKLENKPFAAVDKVATTPLYRDALLTEPYIDISYDTRLPVIGHLGETIQVAVPGGGSAFISTRNATIYDSVSSIPYPTGKDLVNAGKLFLDRPYLWGGASGFAFDCSGFTHTLYDARGITIARDSDAQADFTGHGTNVSRSDLQAGDLIFYASNLTDPSSIYHVAMYAGNGEMLEAYGAGVPVRLTAVRFNDDYWGAERFLTH